jgi:hypothetical protein
MPFASLLGLGVAALAPPARNVARDGPGPPSDPETIAIVLIACLGGVLVFLVSFAVLFALVRRRRSAGLNATQAPAIGCIAAVTRVDPAPGNAHTLSLRVAMPPGVAGAAAGVVTSTVVVRFASDEARARAVEGATLTVRIRRAVPLTLVVDAPGIETVG